MIKRIASGIPGIGSKGPTGDSGRNGLSIFFTNLDGSLNKPLLSEKIKNNLSLESENNSPSEREYENGDIFVDINSLVYEISKTPNNMYNSLGVKYIPNDIFEYSGYSNYFKYKKYTNKYIGDDKFLIDDINSNDFTPLEYSRNNIYDNKIGDFTKVNYTDFKKDNSLFLHEAISNGVSSMGIISSIDNDGTNSFRIGNASKNGYDKYQNILYSPNNINISIDAKKLHIPLNTYCVDDEGTKYKLLSELDYNLGIFKYLKNESIHIDSIINKVFGKNEIGGDTYNLTIKGCNYLDLFNHNISDIEKKVMVNINVYNKKPDYIISSENKNSYTIYNIPNFIEGDGKLYTIENMMTGTWMIQLEIIDLETGWSRYSEFLPLDNTMLFINPRLVNSTLEEQDFNITVEIEGGVVFNRIYTLESLSAENVVLGVLVEGIESLIKDPTPVKITCRNEKYDKTMVIENSPSSYPNVGNYHDSGYIMFHLGYNTTVLDFEFNESNFDFIKEIYHDGKTIYLDINREFQYGTDDSVFLWDESLMEYFTNPQDSLHSKGVSLRLFNNTCFNLSHPNTIYYFSSNNDLNINNIDLNKCKVCRYNGNTDKHIGLIGFSDVYNIFVPASHKYLYIFLDDFGTINHTSMINGVSQNIYINFEDCFSNLYPYINKESYSILNPLYYQSSEEIFLDVSLSNSLFNYSEIGDFKNSTNLMKGLKLTNKITLQPIENGFTEDKFQGFYNINDKRVDFNSSMTYKGFKGCSMKTYDKNDTSDSFLPYYPFFFNDEKKLSFNINSNASPSVFEYKSSFRTINYQSLAKRLFYLVNNSSNTSEVVGDEYRRLTNFNQDIFSRIHNSIMPLDNYISIRPINVGEHNASDIPLISPHAYFINTKNYSMLSETYLPLVNSVSMIVDDGVYEEKIGLTEGYVDIFSILSFKIDNRNNPKFSNSSANYHVSPIQKFSTFNFELNLEYSYILDDTGKTVNGSIYLGKYDSKIENLNTNDTYFIETEKNVSIGNINKPKSNFKYKIIATITTSQEYASYSKNGSWKIASYADFKFDLMIRNGNFYIGNNGRDFENNKPFINNRHEYVDLWCLKN